MATYITRLGRASRHGCRRRRRVVQQYEALPGRRGVLVATRGAWRRTLRVAYIAWKNTRMVFGCRAVTLFRGLVYVSVCETTGFVFTFFLRVSLFLLCA